MFYFFLTLPIVSIVFGKNVISSVCFQVQIISDNSCIEKESILSCWPYAWILGAPLIFLSLLGY